jgi:hypothetical protein
MWMMVMRVLVRREEIGSEEVGEEKVAVEKFGVEEVEVEEVEVGDVGVDEVGAELGEGWKRWCPVVKLDGGRCSVSHPTRGPLIPRGQFTRVVSPWSFFQVEDLRARRF